jgi:hypothetical protein
VFNDATSVLEAKIALRCLQEEVQGVLLRRGPEVWSIEFGVWSMEYGVWCMEYGVWSMEYGVWSMEYGVLSTTLCVCT